MFVNALVITLGVLALVSMPLHSDARFIDDLTKYTFGQFITDFRIKISKEEFPTRLILFTKEIARLIRHNAQKHTTWKETVNKFTIMTEEEKRKYLGRNKNANQQFLKKNEMLHAKRELPAGFIMKNVKDLPKSVDWRQKGVVSAVKDQGMCGSCWAFASTATIESHVAIQSGLLFDLSTEQIAMCAPNTQHCGGTGACQGSTAELAFEYLSGTAGIYQEFQYGYTSYYGQNFDCRAADDVIGHPVAAIQGYVHLPNNNYTALMNAVATVGPVSINVDATPWSAYSYGIFEGCEARNPDINHVVVLVGYGEDEVTVTNKYNKEEKVTKKYWLVRNSWSASWGEAGYIKLARYDNDEENCKIDNTPQDGVVCEDQADTPVKVCGMCGVIYDAAYPTNAKAL